MKSAELKLACVKNTLKSLKGQVKFYTKKEKEYQKAGNKDLEFTSKIVKDAYEFAVDLLEKDLSDEGFGKQN